VNRLIIAGDSFCSDSTGWPDILADLLGLECESYGVGGQHWWGVKKFLDRYHFDQSDILIIVHTNAERIPTDLEEPGQVNFSAPNLSNELDTAVYLYFKHLFNHEFLQWAQHCWIKYIDSVNAGVIVHLHSFDGTTQIPVKNLSVLPSLASISLAENGFTDKTLYADMRSNHLSLHNNKELANQLARLIVDRTTGIVSLDLTKFI
jgi:hypothetical protein